VGVITITCKCRNSYIPGATSDLEWCAICVGYQRNKSKIKIMNVDPKKISMTPKVAAKDLRVFKKPTSTAHIKI